MFALQIKHPMGKTHTWTLVGLYESESEALESGKMRMYKYWKIVDMRDHIKGTFRGREIKC
jgi:hypothetical protein